MTTHRSMSRPGLLPISRRQWLAGAGASLTAFALPAHSRAEEKAADGFRILRARSGEAKLRGRDEVPTAIWGYSGVSPGPTLRVKQGE